MPRKAHVATNLLPGGVRVLVQLYNPDRRSYTQPSGYSLVAPRVQNARELERIWSGIQGFIDGASWREAAQAKPAASTGRS